MEKPFHILNASAGSGKTFSLVRNYLKLLLVEDHTRAELGQIVAMTFTNKAALEMKTRILSDLNKLAGGAPENKAFIDETADFVGISSEKVIANSKLVLRKLLHQYENFNVLTIDKFNLRLIKSFSRDLDLPEQFDIVINQEELMERSIDELMQKVDAKDKGKIYQLALNYSSAQLQAEGKWAIKRSLQEKAKNITKENNFQLIQQLMEKDFSEEEKAKLTETKKKLVFEAQQLGKRIIIAYQNCGLDASDFHYAKRTSDRIEKFAQTDLIEKVDLSYFELSKTFIPNLEKTNEKNPIPELLTAIVAFQKWNDEHLNELVVIDENLRQLPIILLLRELAISLETIRERESSILISEFNKLVSRLVRNEEAPFIYERLGSRYKHFFLDEFQDTSHLQWTNLIPMVHESLSTNNFNFVVGDPKQSIYRFKNGLAEQFVVLPEIYNPGNDLKIAEKSLFFKQQGSKKPLPNNWRSAEEIVNFNNRFFSILKESLPENGQRHYEDILQVPKGKPKGYVQLEYNLEKASVDSENDDTEFETENEAKCIEYVREVIADGYFPGDICILAKTKASCNKYANALKKEGYEIVSADSLLVNSDEGVKLLIQFLSWRNNLYNYQKAQLFAHNYFKLKDEASAIRNYFACFEFVEDPSTGLIAEKKRFSIHEFFVVSGLSRDLIDAPFSSIYSYLKTTISVLNLDLDNNYVKQLLDIAFEYDSKVGPTLSNFLTYYATEAKRSNVQVVQNRNAIKIMTSHKSKGLEFPVVIVPNLKFDSTKRDDLFLSTDYYFIEQSVSKSNSEKGFFSEEITKELDETTMDYVNQLYVTFTRPIDRLYIYDRKSHTDSAFRKLVISTFEQLPGTTTENNLLSLKWGEKPEITHEKSEDAVLYETAELGDTLWFPEISLRDKFSVDEDGLTKQIRLGKQFHGIMEKSASIEEAREIVEEGLISGAIAIEFKEQLLFMIAEFFAHPTSTELFNLGTHLNERTLIVDESNRLRPDKLILGVDKMVIVDFKTGEPLPKHEKQVQQYAAILKKMGYAQIEGYLYYSNTSEYKNVPLG